MTLKAKVLSPKYLSQRYTYKMNKFKPLFDISLVRYKTLKEYPPLKEIKRALKTHLVNHTEILRKLTVGKLIPSQTITALVNTNIAKPLKKRKYKEKLTSSLLIKRLKCPHCNRSYSGDCQVKFPEKIPQYIHDSIIKRPKPLNNIN